MFTQIHIFNNIMEEIKFALNIWYILTILTYIYNYKYQNNYPL